MVGINSAQSVDASVQRKVQIIGGQFKVGGEAGMVGVCIAISSLSLDTYPFS